MKRKQIESLLAGITSHLNVETPDDGKRLSELQKSLAEVLLTQEIPLKEIESNILASKSIVSINFDKGRIKDIVSEAKPVDSENEMQVALRTSDFQSKLFQDARQTGSLKNVIPLLTGIKKAKTEGPFLGAGGIDLSFDFFPILTKLNSLYIEGQTLPALLFKTRTFRFPIEIPFPPIIIPQQKKTSHETRKLGSIEKRKINFPKKISDLKIGNSLFSDKLILKTPKDLSDYFPQTTRLYQLAGNTIWVRANLLSPAAPHGHYCGLRITAGTVFLNSLPTNEKNNKITVSKNTTITVNINLAQKDAPTINDEIFGVDAKEAFYKLPETFSFTLKDTQKSILGISQIECSVFGEKYSLSYENSQSTDYNELISSITIPIKNDQVDFSVKECKSELIDLSGNAVIKNNYWTLFSNAIDITKPLEADGNGGLLFECENGLFCNIKKTEEILSLSQPSVFLYPGNILLIDQKSNGEGLQREINLWKEEDKVFGTSFQIKYRKESVLLFLSDGKGEESLGLLADLNFKVDRPVKVNGEPVKINTKESLVFFNGKSKTRSILILDLNILQDNYIPPSPNQPYPDSVVPLAFALQNALLTVTPVMAISLTGNFDEDFQNVYQASLNTLYGIFNYIPTLPDPYAANIGILIRNNPRQKENIFRIRDVVLNLLNTTSWKENDPITTEFKFQALPNANNIQNQTYNAQSNEGNADAEKTDFQSMFKSSTDDYTELSKANFLSKSYNNQTNTKPNDTIRIIEEIELNILSKDRFTLLDVSSNANQTGVSFKQYQRRRRQKDDGGDATLWEFPLQINKMDVIAQGINSQVFMLPQISWEPTFNLSEQVVTDGSTKANDPPQGFNYYPNDGLPTYVGNLSDEPVALSPIPLSRFLVDIYKSKKDKITYALFNLPFGMVALSLLDNQSDQTKKPTITNISPKFNDSVKGGIQLELTAGNSFAAEGDLFQGITVQLPNVLDMGGFGDKFSTLGSSVHEIFSREFSEAPNNPNDRTRPAVPLEKIGLSGYGANTFSDWRNKNAAFAATSQTTFNVTTGRTMQEVVQVKSVIYPWGIFVVRTITILRLSNGYIMRLDSGWQAVNNGKFYFGINNQPNPYEIHAGLVRGLYNVKNIRENSLTFKDEMEVKDGDTIFDPETNKEIIYHGASYTEDVLLRGLTFDADIDIESVIEGQNPTTNRVPSKGVLGFVQLAPRGMAISKENLFNLLASQNDSIGAPVNCSLKIADTEQHMKINRVDVNNSKDMSNQPIFVAAARGSVVLPKEGSWTMVTHKASDGTVTPLDTNISVPLIRKGKWDLGKLENIVDLQNLQRIAHPIELVREAGAETINFGFLQNLDTQKLLFLTPSFKIGIDSLLSKTPPLMADGYRLLNSKGIFPNVGDAIDNLGDAVKLLKVAGGANDIFSKVAGVTDGAKDVYKLLEIASKVDGGKLVDQGYEILKSGIDGQINKALNFDFPAGDYKLINNENFKIIIKYKADNESKLDYNLDSFADDFEDQWRGRLNNVSIVVSLGPFTDLMTVMGNSNNEKGKESNFGGKISAGADTLPTPKIVFSDAVEPVIQILEILQDVSGGDYADAFNKGLKVAMSNSANIWEYKYEATKEIGLIRFPPAPAYEAPQTPLKLEASLSIGFSFNAALKVTSDPKDLLPSAGAFFKFHGGLQVMCVSVAAATIYAIGNVDLKIAADTTPMLGVDMKFGFGAQLSVGLPVIGTVSIQFMISVEIHADTGNNVSVAAMMMFRGHAEILGGIVGVTITIEAKGAIEKSGDGPTNCRASVTFGLDISIAFIINISFSKSWEETKQIA
ncbi:hypothetical protein [Aequorivita capsosiphonis]|uniref:hypothetical protein n=1 Tax=Aequorivita capsosiphonis TaxID=487317 RepID=UPI00041436DD|nr:hypothetical protein [Aequorivita capsosiphonis]